MKFEDLRLLKKFEANFSLIESKLVRGFIHNGALGSSCFICSMGATTIAFFDEEKNFFTISKVKRKLGVNVNKRAT